MSYISWNSKGMGSNQTIQSLRKIIKSKRPFIVFLMETKQKHNRLSKLGKEMGFPYGHYVDPVGLLEVCAL